MVIDPDAQVHTCVIAPARMPCPRCGRPGKRREIVEVWCRDIAFGEEALVLSRLGVYRSRCDCQEFFQAENPEAPHRWGYTVRVREAVVNSVVRDHLSVQKVIVRFREDFLLELSEGFVYQCLAWADQEFDLEEYYRTVTQNFTGVLAVDELVDGPFKIVFATDPKQDVTIGFKLVTSATREEVEPFLIEMRDRGIKPAVVLTDDSKLYPEMLQAVWPGVDHQTCVFHYLKNAGRAIIKAVRKVAKKVPGRPKRRRGRPSKRGRPRKKVSDRDFVNRRRFLIVKKPEKITSEKDREDLARLLELHPDLAQLRDLTLRLHDVFEPGITKQQARYRRTRLLQHPTIQIYGTQLKGLIGPLKGDTFERLISFLTREDGERTSNHVERTNRGYRLIQKVRYRYRSRESIERAIRLHLARRARERDPGRIDHVIVTRVNPASEAGLMAVGL